ncbi:hypothetical protein ACTFIW_002981 [Dictyostelium discoideum]
MMEDEIDIDFSNEISRQDVLQLREYYDKLFPFDLLYDWLTINSINEKEEDKKRAFERREFSVRINKVSSSYVIRNKSFNRVEDLKEFLKGRQNIDGVYEVPERLDIGPICSWEPSKKATVSDYQPVSKELVFDIDVDDYNPIRICCSSKSLCEKCWGFLAVSAEFIDNYLRECFGFQQIMYVFSGRRGLHIWVSDRAAQHLTRENRASILNHIRVELSQNQIPILRRSFDQILLPHFEKCIIEEQQIFTNEKQRKYFLSLLPISYKRQDRKITLTPSEDIEKKLKEIQNENLSNSEIWFAVKSYLEDNNLKEHLYNLVFHYTMPRIDEPVSIGLDHLLKSPFCIHPDTKKLCVPLDINEIYKFNPNQVPTVDQLISDPKLFNKFKKIFKNHVNQMKLKYNLTIQDPMEF